MIFGESWAFGHLPKTGGDAAARYLQLLEPGCRCDALNDPAKHATFWTRGDAHDKQFFLLGIRLLPAWTWSLMQEFNVQPKLLKLFGVPNAATIDFAMSRPFADEYLLSMTQGVTITTWIRQEHLFDDLAGFIRQFVRDVPAAELDRIRETTPTKRGRRRGDPFTASQAAELRRLNPHWARIERQVYR